VGTVRLVEFFLNSNLVALSGIFSPHPQASKASRWADRSKMSSLSKELRRLRKLEKDYLWCIRYLNEWGIEKDHQLSLLKWQSAQQNMHWTVGIVRRFKQFSIVKFILSLWHSLASRQ